jgi:hypothetical protein
VPNGSSPRAPFDQGLFLTHFNKGKDLYDQKRYEEAERELEEAYLLRPRDQKVLNLLGLVYFKQEKYEKAEEVYRKLAAESPDAQTLFYNLGLIYFKLNRLEEAESAFLKAIELSPDNPKISFYLGSIYERMHRFQDAIFQYRQAGANIMVRRVEDKIAAGAPPRAPVPSAPPPPPPPPPARPAASGARPPRLDDTAEFKASEIRAALEAREKTSPLLFPGKTVGPVSDGLMAQGAPRTIRSESAASNSQTLPPGALRSAEVLVPRPQVGPPVNQFRFLENNLMEVSFSGKVFIKQGTIYSYSGNLTFWVKDKRPGGHSALVIITGTGRVILTDKDREITFMNVQDETVHVEPEHLLACEETLTPRYEPLSPARGAPEFLVLEGRGMLALSVAGKPLAMQITPEMPVSVPAASLISWSGAVRPHLIEDPQLYEVLAPSGGGGGPLVRLEGQGRLLVEQGSSRGSSG